jgi:hypothetical protein
MKEHNYVKIVQTLETAFPGAQITIYLSRTKRLNGFNIIHEGEMYCLEVSLAVLGEHPLHETIESHFDEWKKQSVKGLRITFYDAAHTQLKLELFNPPKVI